MKCISPPALTDLELLAYLDQEAGPEVAMHLDQCPHCRERAASLADSQDSLTRALFRSLCPTSLELGDFELGMLASARISAVAQHLQSCPYCRQEVAQLQRFLASPDPMRQPSPWERAKGRVRVVVAQLLSGPQWTGLPSFGAPAPALAGIRGAEEAPFIFEADDVQVVIEIHGDPEWPDRKSILGLVMGVDDPGAMKAHLWQAGTLRNTQPVDGLGNFVFSNLPAECFELILSGLDTEIHIQELDLATN